MCEKSPLFPNGIDDVFLDVNEVNISTNFSHMGEADGIEITCFVRYKTKHNEILMHPDWETNEPTDNLKERFPNGYFAFEYYKEERIQYHFFVDYIKERDSFLLKLVKKKELPQHYYINSIHQRYTEEAIQQFHETLVQQIIQKYIRKKPYE